MDRPASEDSKALLAANPDREYRTTSVAFFEILRGGAHFRGTAGVADLIEQLNQADHLSLTPSVVREAALIGGVLEKSGQKINLGDVLIAGAIREASGMIVTRDSHFENIDGLNVKRYRVWQGTVELD